MKINLIKLETELNIIIQYYINLGIPIENKYYTIQDYKSYFGFHSFIENRKLFDYISEYKHLSQEFIIYFYPYLSSNVLKLQPITEKTLIALIENDDSDNYIESIKKSIIGFKLSNKFKLLYDKLLI